MRTVKEMQEHILGKAASDAEFRASLLGNARDTIEKELGVTFPDQFTIQVHEDSLTSAHLVLPPRTGPEAMSEEELAAVVGGNAECNIGHEYHHDDYHVPLGGC